MRLEKTILGSCIVFLAIYTLIAWKTIELGNNDGNTCTTAVLRSVAPWSSGCFYTALFQDTTVSQEQIDFEKSMLDRFSKKQGTSPKVLWYRSKFYQKYRLRFRANFQDLHYLHADYTRAEHTKLGSQVDYLRFLIRMTSSPLHKKP
jgi:hypothetical protein